MQVQVVSLLFAVLLASPVRLIAQDLRASAVDGCRARPSVSPRRRVRLLAAISTGRFSPPA